MGRAARRLPGARGSPKRGEILGAEVGVSRRRAYFLEGLRLSAEAVARRPAVAGGEAFGKPE